MQPIAKAGSKQRVPEFQFRPGVLATDARHHPAALRRGRKLHDRMVRGKHEWEVSTRPRGNERTVGCNTRLPMCYVMGEIFVERSSEEMVSKLSGWISAERERTVSSAPVRLLPKIPS